ncbi:MAG: shikimate kinase [Bacteroidetes bacterium]|nr:shikimate kinase [Bacteroidota bacterium]
MKIFLIGLPGSGKTTLGKTLAEKLNLPFVDLDTEIEKSEGKTVQQLFIEKQEANFREVESATLKKYCAAKTEFVMATGGGAPCFFDNMNTMNQAGTTIYLDVPASTIALRMQPSDLVNRPLFAEVKPGQIKNKIESLRLLRLPFYEKAHFRFSSETISTENILQKIREQTQR